VVVVDSKLIEKHFGDIWPLHNRAFNALLIECRAAFDGDLDKMLILSLVGERTLTPGRGAGISYERFLAGQRGQPPSMPINMQSISDCSGIPRETVRRKTEQLIARGWLMREADGSLTVTPNASKEMQALTELTFSYLVSIGRCLLEICNDGDRSESR
jgi:hypothetical protein